MSGSAKRVLAKPRVEIGSAAAKPTELVHLGEPLDETNDKPATAAQSDRGRCTRARERGIGLRILVERGQQLIGGVGRGR